MDPYKVTFKTVDAEIETRGADDNKRTMDVIEISYPDGKVVAFPVNEVSPETHQRYREMFPAKYKAFKNGEPDPDRVEALEREIAERQAELDGMQRPKDDERVRENLGYGGKTELPDDRKPKFDAHTRDSPKDDDALKAGTAGNTTQANTAKGKKHS
jgi:hypothetical protein